jgi:xanthine dehydrogenase iron-sulfur cluster and FAD-binding subunit A
MRACVLQVENLSEGQKIKSIEGLSENGDHPLQKVWTETKAPQCGYCQCGQITQAAALLEQNPNPSRAETKAKINGILCRCYTHLRVIKAIEIATLNQLNSKIVSASKSGYSRRDFFNSSSYVALFIGIFGLLLQPFSGPVLISISSFF